MRTDKRPLFIPVLFLLFACILETKYTLSDREEAVVLDELEGNFLVKNDTSKVEFRRREDGLSYDVFLKTGKDSVLEHHQAFISDLKGRYFLNFNTKDLLEDKEQKELYQFFKIDMPEDVDLELTQVSDSLFEKKDFKSEREFREYFISHIDDPMLFKGTKKDRIRLIRDD